MSHRDSGRRCAVLHHDGEGQCIRCADCGEDVRPSAMGGYCAGPRPDQPAVMVQSSEWSEHGGVIALREVVASDIGAPTGVLPAAPVVALIRLLEACRELRVGEKFGYPVELIGSALHKSDPRDYDLRILMSEEDFRFHFALAPSDWQKEGREGKAWSELRLTWSLRCTDWSKRLSERSGCNVDFQIWPRSFVKGASFTLVPL